MSTKTKNVLSHAERFELREKIKKLIEEDGANPEEVAKKYKLSSDYIKRFCNTKVQRLSYKPYIFSIIAELCNTQETLENLAKKYEVPNTFVREIYRSCVANQVPVHIRKRGRPTK